MTLPQMRLLTEDQQSRRTFPCRSVAKAISVVINTKIFKLSPWGVVSSVLRQPANFRHRCTQMLAHYQLFLGQLPLNSISPGYLCQRQVGELTVGKWHRDTKRGLRKKQIRGYMFRPRMFSQVFSRSSQGYHDDWGRYY